MSDSSLYDSFIGTTGSYTCIISPSGVIESISDPFAHLLALRHKEDLVGINAIDAVQGSVELKTLFTDICNVSPKTEIPSTRLVHVHRNAEKPLWIKFDIRSNVHQGKDAGIVLTGLDVTDLVISQKDAEKKALQRSSFLVKMGHELRTPLNTVLGYAQLLSGLTDLSPTAATYTQVILTHENSLLRILNDILEYSKYESGQITPVYTEVNLRKLIQDVTKSYIEQCNAKTVALTVELSPTIPETIQSDSIKLTQILSNLLANALTNTRKGGITVTVSCDRVIIIDVEDTGTGIPLHEQDTIFEVYATDEEGKELPRGSGIGLAVARLFARTLGGDVTLVRSDSLTGSLFRCTLEARESSSKKRELQQITDYTTIHGLSRPCKVLLVDDVDINLAMLEIFLAPAGFNVSIASNGEEAVNIFKQFKPDIVFMDLIMPGKNGFDATRDIKNIDGSVPVIALTASIVDSIKEQALQAGVDDFMYKPFIPERFFEIIAEHTGISYVTN